MDTLHWQLVELDWPDVPTPPPWSTAWTLFAGSLGDLDWPVVPTSPPWSTAWTLFTGSLLNWTGLMFPPLLPSAQLGHSSLAAC